MTFPFKIIRILLGICFVCSATSSCSWLGHTYEPRENLFITGESLTDTKLLYGRASPDSENEVIFNFRGSYRFECAPDYNTKKTNYPSESHYQYWRVPSDELFDEFGSNESRIRSDFQKIRKSFMNQEHPYVSTILYSGGLCFTADKEFAGHPAGSDLSPYIDHVQFGLTKDQAEPYIHLPFDYQCMVSNFVYFDLLVPGYGVTEARTPVPSVTFELKIPVRVVMYLTWLNDRISDEDAPMPYRDDTLSCSFTVKDRLKKIE